MAVCCLTPPGPDAAAPKEVPDEDIGETLKTHALFLENEFVECPFDVYSLDRHRLSTFLG